jgi:hypothetical protein
VIASRAGLRGSEEAQVHAWIHRHRHQLRALYGMPPEPRIQALMDRAREAEEAQTRAAERAAAADPESPAADAPRKLRQHTLQPRRRTG